MAQQRGILGRWADWARQLLAPGPVEAASPPPSGASLIEGVGWIEFERLVAEGFRHRGYAVSETGGHGGRAIDMVLTRGHDRFLVDCKPWRSQAVGVAPVRELLAMVRARNVSGGFVLSSGVFTAEAKAFVQGHPITLIDGSTLRELLQVREEKTQPVIVRREGPFPDSTLPPSAWRLRTQPCPLCGGAMVETVRENKAVLACTHHPLCEGQREL
ncbi:MAG: restriction endonuclease [Rhizobacter sp.]